MRPRRPMGGMRQQPQMMGMGGRGMAQRPQMQRPMMQPQMAYQQPMMQQPMMQRPMMNPPPPPAPYGGFGAQAMPTGHYNPYMF